MSNILISNINPYWKPDLGYIGFSYNIKADQACSVTLKYHDIRCIISIIDPGTGKALDSFTYDVAEHENGHLAGFSLPAVLTHPSNITTENVKYYSYIPITELHADFEDYYGLNVIIDVTVVIERPEYSTNIVRTDKLPTTIDTGGQTRTLSLDHSNDGWLLSGFLTENNYQDGNDLITTIKALNAADKRIFPVYPDNIENFTIPWLSGFETMAMAYANWNDIQTRTDFDARTWSHANQSFSNSASISNCWNANARLGLMDIVTNQFETTFAIAGLDNQKKTNTDMQLTREEFTEIAKDILDATDSQKVFTTIELIKFNHDNAEQELTVNLTPNGRELCYIKKINTHVAATGSEYSMKVIYNNEDIDSTLKVIPDGIEGSDEAGGYFADLVKFRGNVSGQILMYKAWVGF